VPDLPRSGTLPAWTLKLTAVAAVLNVFFFGFGYAHANVKSIAAPLQPPVAGSSSVATPAPTLAPTVSTGTDRRGRLPTTTLRPAVRTSGSAPLTTTRHS
jgi:hypothetical protein